MPPIHLFSCIHEVVQESLLSCLCTGFVSSHTPLTKVEYYPQPPGLDNSLIGLFDSTLEDEYCDRCRLSFGDPSELRSKNLANSNLAYRGYPSPNTKKYPVFSSPVLKQTTHVTAMETQKLFMLLALDRVGQCNVYICIRFAHVLFCHIWV